MANSKRFAISFGSYIKQLSKVVFSSTLILGLIIGVSLLFIGEASINLDIGLEFSAIDGLWVMLGFPIASVLLFVLLSPLSFYIYKLISRRKLANAPPDA